MRILALLLAIAAPTQRGEYRRSVTTADGLRLGVFLYLPPGGQQDGPLVVLLPDVGSSHEAFDLPSQGLARLLRSRGLRVLTLDWRGTGSSSHGISTDGLSALLQEDLPAAVQTVGGSPRLVLVGWGYGGAVAYAAAVAGPLASRVEGVVGLNAVVEADVPNPLVERLLDRGRGGLDLGHELAQPCADGAETLFSRLWTHGAPVDDAASDQVLHHGLGGITAAQAEAMLSWMKLGRTELGGPYPELVSRIRVPVMAVLGPLDNWSHPEFASGIADRLPRSQVRLVRVSRLEGFGGDASHLALAEGPLARELSPMIESFVRQIDAAPSAPALDAGAP